MYNLHLSRYSKKQLEAKLSSPANICDYSANACSGDDLIIETDDHVVDREL